jgi:catechol 2,3-dioxygenase-like lactoylglutathione lyase family enzyme
MRAFRPIVGGALTFLLAAGSGAVEQSSKSRSPAVIGLDHVPIAVRDLEAAAERYRALGFSLKPGRPHPNGIRNQHVKLPDGTELELITAPEARDALTTKYRRHLQEGDGPAFLALFLPDKARVPRDLHPSLAYLFFGLRNASPTDRPEHFAHPNSSSALMAVWLSGSDLEQERALFPELGASILKRHVSVPVRVHAEVAAFREGDVVLLPGSHQRVQGRRIVGVTLRARSVARARELLDARRIPVTEGASPSKSLFIAPDAAHGLWIELREQQ